MDALAAKPLRLFLGLHPSATVINSSRRLRVSTASSTGARLLFQYQSPAQNRDRSSDNRSYSVRDRSARYARCRNHQSRFRIPAVEPGEVSHRFFFINHRPLGYLQHHVKVVGWQRGGEAQHIVAEAVGLQMGRGNIQPQLSRRAAEYASTPQRRWRSARAGDGLAARSSAGFRPRLIKTSGGNFTNHRMAPAH